MLTVPQIEKIISAEIENDDGNTSPASIAAQKIHDLCNPDHTLHIAAAALENEVTSTLIDMLTASFLATLIEEEGGGRVNISFSPLTMADLLERWDYTVEINGLARTVRIAPKDDAWEPTDASPSDVKLSQLIDSAPPTDNLQPQAGPHEYNRPVWAVVCNNGPEGEVSIYRQHDRAGAERELRSWRPDAALAANAHIENRWCLHPECPSTGCLQDSTKRDEVTS